MNGYIVKQAAAQKEAQEPCGKARKEEISEVNITIRNGNVIRFEHTVRFLEEECMYGDGI